MPNKSIQNIELASQNNINKSLIQLADFLVDSNLIIATGATLLALESLILINSATIGTLQLLVVFFSCMIIYHLAEMNLSVCLKNNLKFKFVHTESNLFHRNMFVAACLLLVFIVPFLSLSEIILLTLLAVVSITYGLIKSSIAGFNLRQYPVFKNIMLALMWTIVTVAYPLFAEGISLISSQVLFIFCERFLFILVLSFMFDLRDFYTDPKQGIHTAATIFGYKKLKNISQALLILLGLITFFHLAIFYYDSNSYLVLTAIILSLLITSFFIFITNQQKTKRHYSLLFDGATVIQAVLVLMLSLLVI